MAEVNGVVDRGVACMNERCEIWPWLTGEPFTMANIYVRYVFSVVAIGVNLLKRDIVSEIDGLGDWLARMSELPESRRIDADLEANRESFFAYIASLA